MNTFIQGVYMQSYTGLSPAKSIPTRSSSYDSFSGAKQHLTVYTNTDMFMWR